MSENKKIIKGVDRITGYINKKVIPNIPGKISNDTVRRELIKYGCGSGGLVHEPRENNKQPFEIDQTSLDALHDPCNVWDYENIAEFCGKSERWVKAQAKNDPDFPLYRLSGRVYSTQSSLGDYMLKYCRRPGKWSTFDRYKKRWSEAVTSGDNTH